MDDIVVQLETLRREWADVRRMTDHLTALTLHVSIAANLALLTLSQPPGQGYAQRHEN